MIWFAIYIHTRDNILKFTLIFEQTNNFPFLDVKITRGSQGIATSVFCKARFSGAFTSFDSFNFESYETRLAVLQFAQIGKNLIQVR